MKLSKQILAMFAVVAFPAFTAGAVSAQVISREAELKGKIVGILANKVTWPSDRVPTNANPLTIGILGDDPFVDNRGVNHLAQRLAGTGAVLLNFPNVAAYQPCHVLVVSKSTNFEEAFAKTKGQSVLIVSESPGLAGKGAAINIVFDQANNKLRLEINPRTARKADLEIDRGLLQSPLVDIVNINVNLN